MDDTQLLDCTQVLPSDLDDEEEKKQVLVGWLEVDGTRHEIFSGKNIIGRDPAESNIVIPNKVLSKQHATIEVRAGTHTIADLNSSNKTRIGKMALRPQVQYALQGGERLRFGNVTATYTIQSRNCDEDSGSDTDSESMLPLRQDGEEEEALSPTLSSKQHPLPGTPMESHGVVQNGTHECFVPESPSVSQGSRTPLTRGHGGTVLESPVPPTPNLGESPTKLDDTEKSCVSPSQPSTKSNLDSRFSTLSAAVSGEDYNSDESTDLEDDAPTQPYPKETLLGKDQASGRAGGKGDREDPKLSDNVRENTSNRSFEDCTQDVLEAFGYKQKTPGGERGGLLPSTESFSVDSSDSGEDDIPTQPFKEDDLAFRKPLRTVHKLRRSRDPGTGIASPRSPGNITDPRTSEFLDAPTQPYIDPDAPTQVFSPGLQDDTFDAPTQPFPADISVASACNDQINEPSNDTLEAPTQVFSHDAPDVDYDAPTQVFSNDDPTVDNDAPDVDYDAPTQVFSNDAPSVDHDAPTQVFSNDAPDVDHDAPTQVFSNDAPDVDHDAPTQVFSNDAPSVDHDAPSHSLSDKACDDVPTQVFSGNKSGCDIFDVPTQVFSNNSPEASDADDDLAPTQVFSHSVPKPAGCKNPTQEAIPPKEAAMDDPPDSPTLLDDSTDAGNLTEPFLALNKPQGMELPQDSGLGKEDSAEACEQDHKDETLQQTQVFSSPGTEVDCDAPTQLFESITFTPKTAVAKGSAETMTTPPSRPGSSTTAHPSSPPHTHPPPTTTLLPQFDDDTLEATQLFTGENTKETMAGAESSLLRKNEECNLDVPTQPFIGEDSLEAPTQLFPDKDGGPNLVPSRSIMDVWGHLDSATSLGFSSTSTPLPCRTKGRRDSDAASDTSETLLRGEIDIKSHHYEEGKETGQAVVKDKEEGRRGLEGDNYHSDESTDIEDNTPTTHLENSSQSSVKKPTVVQESDGLGMEPDTHISVSPQKAIQAGGDDVVSTPKPTPVSPSQHSSEGETSTACKAQDTPHTSNATVAGMHSKNSDHILPTDPPASKSSMNSQESFVSVAVSLSDCCFVLSGESTNQEKGESSASITPHKKRTLHQGYVSDSDSDAENIDCSMKLFDLPSDTDDQSHPSTPGTPARSSHVLRKKTTVPQTCQSDNTSGSSKKVPAASTATITTTTTTTTTSTTTSTNTSKTPVTKARGRRSKLQNKSDDTTTTTAIPVPQQESKVKTRGGSQPRRATGQSKASVGSEDIKPALSANTEVDKTNRSTTRKKALPAVSDVSESVQPTTSGTSIVNRRSKRGKNVTSPPVVKVKLEMIEDNTVDELNDVVIKQEKEATDVTQEELLNIKTEPPEDPENEAGGRGRRMRRQPNRFSPERETKTATRRLRSRNAKSSLVSHEGTESELREEETVKSDISTAGGSGQAIRKVQTEQRQSRRVSARTGLRGQGGETSRGETVVETMGIRIKREKEEESDGEPEALQPTSRSSNRLAALQQPQASDAPQRNRRYSRRSGSSATASTSMSATQEQPRTAKKIKIEITSDDDIEEEDEEEYIPETTQSKRTQATARRSRKSSVKKAAPKKRLSQNQASSSNDRESYVSQRSKRSSDSELSESQSSVNSSISSRATRSNKDVELWTPSKRQKQASTKPRVLFTGYQDANDHKIVTDLGGKVVESALDCTVLVTIKLKRTCKLLSAIGRGYPIVNPDWLATSKRAGNFVDPWQFLVQDHEAEEKFGFSLEQTIKSASGVLLFEGLSIHATPLVQPPPCQMRDIVECSGGDYLHVAPKKYAPHIRIVSCPEDKRHWPTFKALGIPILGVEFILTGLLRHELLLDEFVLA